MKRYIRCSYSPQDLEDEVNYYQSMYTTGELTQSVLEEIWNDVYDRYADESLADDVVEALDGGYTGIYSSKITSSSSIEKIFQEIHDKYTDDGFSDFDEAVGSFYFDELHNTTDPEIAKIGDYLAQQKAYLNWLKRKYPREFAQYDKYTTFR